MKLEELKAKAKRLFKAYESVYEDEHGRNVSVVYHRSIWFWELLYSLFVALWFFVLTDEGSKLTLETLGNCVSVKVLRWGIGSLVVACTIFLGYWKWKNDKCVGAFEAKDNTITTLQETISDLKVVAKRFNTVHDNLHLIFLRHLEAIGDTLKFGCTDRISLYVLDGDRFVQIARHSQNPEYKKRGRLIYPINQGVIAETRSDNELIYRASLPDYKTSPAKYVEVLSKKYGMNKDVVEGLTMHPRFMAGLRISSPDGNDWKAVLIVESGRANAWQKKEICDVLTRNKTCMYKLMCDFPDCISSISAAQKEGL